MIVVAQTPQSPSHSVPVRTDGRLLRLPIPPVEAPAVDVAVRAAQCVLIERRRGASGPTRELYGRAHSLLRALRRHLATLDERIPAA